MRNPARSARRVVWGLLDRPQLGVPLMAMRGTDDNDATLDDLGLDESGGIRALTSQRDGVPHTARLLELVARGDGVRPILRGALPQLGADLGAQRGAVLLWRDESPSLEIVGRPKLPPR